MEHSYSGLISRRNVLKVLSGTTIASFVPFSVKANQLFITPVEEANQGKKKYYCYRSFWPELDMTARFKELGVNHRCFYAANTINSMGFEYCKYPLIWKGIKKYDFAAYDRQVEDLLSANPSAKFLCMVDLNTPYWMTRNFAFDSFSDISHAASNKEWLKMTTQWMTDFIEYSEKKYGDKVDAYILTGGGTSEWYEYDRGRSSHEKNAAWREWCEKNGFFFGEDVPGESRLKKAAHENVIFDPETESDKIQYWRFHNEIIAEAILHFAKVARLLIGKGKEIGVFFGYYMVSDTRIVSFGHLDYERVFASPDIDFFISPGSYHDRMIGGGSGSQTVDGTLLRYGKRYLHEIDHRTHCVENRWKTQQTWQSQEEDIAGIKREAAFALINHASLWWFDMWGGWYQIKETRQLIGQLKKVYDRYIDDESSSVAETLLIADPQSLYHVNEKMPHAIAMTEQIRDKLNKTGAPFDVYSFNDIPVIDLSRYKVVLLPATLLITPERAEILKKYVLTQNRTIVWTYAPGICDGKTLDTARIRQWTGAEYGTHGPVIVQMNGWSSVYTFEYATITPTLLKNVMKKAKVHMYTDEENPVYANERLLAVHFKEGGKKKISLPRSFRKVVDVISEKVIAENTSAFECEFFSPDTKIFELVK